MIVGVTSLLGASLGLVEKAEKPNPNWNRRISDNGLQHIKRFEGFYEYVYDDLSPLQSGRHPEWKGGYVHGTLTIGYGHTNLSGREPRLHPGMRVTEKVASDILVNVLRDVYEPALRRNVKVPLNQGQWDAMVSWIYNLGEPNLKKSTLLKRINQGRFDDVPAEIMKWNRAGGRVLRGLSNRRRAECAMWRGPHEIDPSLPDRSAVGVQPRTGFDPPPPQPLTDNDRWIERIGVLGPPLTSLVAAVKDWQTAAVISAAVLVLLLYFAHRNRHED